MSEMIAYLSSLEKNNDRAWYHASKAERQAALRAFESLIGSLQLALSADHPGLMAHTPGELIFRLARDTRFSRDPSPYLPAFRCHIAPAGRLPIPVGYYLYIRPGNRSFLGGGLFADMFREATQRVRDAINAQPDDFARVISALEAAGMHVQGNALKRVPRGYDPAHPMAVYLAHKSWYIQVPFDDMLLDDPQAFLRFAAASFRDMDPLNRFLNAALRCLTVPGRSI